MRRDLEFVTGDGLTLRGWHVLPDDGGPGPYPTIVLAHGLSAVKEMGLAGFADAFAAAGFASVVFDHRSFGASDGEPRQEADPLLQVRDYRDAITYAETLAETDAGRVGVWGSSYSGGHAITVGAWDRRVRAVVAQVPVISGRENARHLIPSPILAHAARGGHADRLARFRGEPPAYLPVVAETGGAMMPTADSHEWFTRLGAGTSWENRLTLRSAELADEYEPGRVIDRVSPTPLLMVLALGDSLCAADTALGAWQHAREPKRLLTLDCGHFDVYAGPFFDRASQAAVAWFSEHL